MISFTPESNTLKHVDAPRKLSGNSLIAYKAKLKLNNEQKHVIIGSLLGDGYLNYNRSVKQPTYNFCFAQGLSSATWITCIKCLNHL